MENTLRYDDASTIARKVGCIEILAATIKVTDDKEPPPNIEATIVCLHKIKHGAEANQDLCCVVDGQPCPLNKVPEQKLIQIRKEVEQAAGHEKT